ncbi:MAG: tetratricopeptide repeat protein, partial [Desulfovibrionales bacterium]
WAFNNRGVSRIQTGELLEAVEDISMAIRLDPNEPEFFFNRALAYETGNSFEKALDDYTRAVAEDPNFAAAYSNRGMLYLRLGEQSRGCTDLKTACDLDLCRQFERAKEIGECRSDVF